MNTKSTVSGLAAVVLCISMLAARAAGSGGPEAVVELYFTALREGDIAGLTSTLSESFYNKRKVLLEHNPRYAGFLREMYRDVTVNIGDIETTDSQAEVTVQLIRSGNDPEELVLILKQADDGTWKIDGEQGQ